jgi:hypothetical protein
MPIDLDYQRRRGDVPAVGLIGHAELPSPFNRLSLRHLLKLAREGRFVPPLVMGNRWRPTAWSAAAVRAHMEQKVAAGESEESS